MLKIFFLMTFFTSLTWAKGSTMIETVIQDYFHGYQEADVSLIQKAFQGDTKLLSISEGKLEVTEMKDWLKNLEERRLKGDIRKGVLKIESMDVTDDAASVKVLIQFPKFEFTDYLSLLRISGKWMIVGKIYHYREIKNP
jgi:Putative lumazine-binding